MDGGFLLPALGLTLVVTLVGTVAGTVRPSGGARCSVVPLSSALEAALGAANQTITVPANGQAFLPTSPSTQWFVAAPYSGRSLLSVQFASSVCATPDLAHLTVDCTGLGPHPTVPPQLAYNSEYAVTAAGGLLFTNPNSDDVNVTFSEGIC
jgi:hypothetical protein